MTTTIGRPRRIKRHEAMLARDAKIAGLIASGASVRAIAKQLGVTMRTVSSSKLRLGTASSEIEVEATIGESRINEGSGVLVRPNTSRDQPIKITADSCASCGLPRTYPRHRSDGPYPPLCDFRAAM